MTRTSRLAVRVVAFVGSACLASIAIADVNLLELTSESRFSSALYRPPAVSDHQTIGSLSAWNAAGHALSTAASAVAPPLGGYFSEDESGAWSTFIQPGVLSEYRSYAAVGGYYLESNGVNYARNEITLQSRTLVTNVHSGPGSGDRMYGVSHSAHGFLTAGSYPYLPDNSFASAEEQVDWTVLRYDGAVIARGSWSGSAQVTNGSDWNLNLKLETRGDWENAGRRLYVEDTDHYPGFEISSLLTSPQYVIQGGETQTIDMVFHGVYTAGTTQDSGWLTRSIADFSGTDLLDYVAVDPATGERATDVTFTLLGPLPAVPEPSTWALLLAGLVLLVAASAPAKRRAAREGRHTAHPHAGPGRAWGTATLISLLMVGTESVAGVIPRPIANYDAYAVVNADDGGRGSGWVTRSSGEISDTASGITGHGFALADASPSPHAWASTNATANDLLVGTTHWVASAQSHLTYQVAVDTIDSADAYTGLIPIAIQSRHRLSVGGGGAGGVVLSVSGGAVKSERVGGSEHWGINTVGRFLVIHTEAFEANQTLHGVPGTYLTVSESAYCSAAGWTSPQVASDLPESGSCNAFVDPVISLDQAQFDREQAAAGEPTFTLSDRFELVFSPGILNVATEPVPEPAVGMIFGVGMAVLFLFRPSRRSGSERPTFHDSGATPSRTSATPAWVAWLLIALGSGASWAGQVEGDIVVNGRSLDAGQVAALERSLGGRTRSGRYWYDAKTGWWGREGGPTIGVVMPGRRIGSELSPTASNGTTGVFINGRELHAYEVAYLRTLGPVLPGRYWADAMGNVGVEGQGWPFTNLYQLAQQRYGDRGPHRVGNGAFNSDGRCTYYQGKDASGNAIGASSGC